MSPPPPRRKKRPSKAAPSKRPRAKGPRAKSPSPKRRPARKGSSSSQESQQTGERLQKVLAAAGIGSRRQCEELITAGRIEVDRKMVTELGTRVDLSTQEIRVDGDALLKKRRVYYAVNKPTGVVSTNNDPAGRPRVIDLIPTPDMRLFTIGRLDLHSEGLILVTNDGELANQLTHPRYGVEKTYRVQVAGRPTKEIFEKLRRGIRLPEGIAKVVGIQVKSHHKDSTILEMVLREGRNREIRRLLARVGHKVQRLVRTAVGPVRLGKLPPGESRKLTSQELKALRHAAEHSG